MSVMIRGMKLPDNCLECPLETDYGTCGYYSLFVEAGHDSEVWKRRDDCPLVEVPPHGRLIDADALERMFADIDNAPYSGFDGEEAFYSAADAAQIIRLAPTIIPAEEDE